MNDAAGPKLASIAPFFIVRDVSASVSYYRDRLGFALAFATPREEPFFAILDRDGVSLMIKAIGSDVLPVPNHRQHPWARWDAFVHTPEPDSLAAEFESRDVEFHAPLADTDDQLRGFEIQDPDGYVLFFGRPT